MERTLILASLTDDEVSALQYDWEFWARPKQLPPAKSWDVWLLLSGRGFGKTRSGSEWVISRAMHGPYHPIALIGKTKADVRDTMVETGDSSILKCSPPWFYPKYESSKRRLTWPNGMVAVIYSGDEPDQLRGPQHGSAWVDELCKMRYPQETWDNMEFGLRLGLHPQTCITTTPRPMPLLRAIMSDAMTVVVTGSTYENVSNLPDKYLSRLRNRYEGTRLGQQEIYADILDDTPGALWTRGNIEETRVNKFPSFLRAVVAVDPAVSANEDSSNETGIISSGIDEDMHGYVVRDLSGIYTPMSWAESSIREYDRIQADAIVAETNNGGDLVISNIKTTARIMFAKGERDTDYVNVVSVRATRGKYTRAEPVSGLYEQKRVHHVGMFADLEDQLCTWIPGNDSPDRLDALVWGFTYMLPDIGNSGRLLL